MAQAVPSTQVNGNAPTTLDESAAQVAFYEQLLQLRDAVLSDRHPHFKLPADVKHRLQSEKASTSDSSGYIQQLLGLTTDIPGGTQAAAGTQYNGQMTDGARNVLAYNENRSSHANQVPQLKTHPSGIDPVLLTKSDDLIRAEIHLKRQRIEKQLKESADQRKPFARRDQDAEPTTLVDLPDILQKAWDTVKPISGLKPPTNVQTAASDSFDENSYYSSQVNDWSSESSVDNRRDKAAAVAPLLPTVVKQPPTGPASSAPISKQRQPAIERRYAPQAYPLQSFASEEGPGSYANDTEGAYDAEREDSEDYSPPAAEAFSGADGADADAMDLDDDSSEFVPEEPAIPSFRAPVITNNLMHIAAPQPARVSPLAVAGAPGLGQSSVRRAQADRIVSPRLQAQSALTSRANERAMSEESTTSPRNSGQTSPNFPLSKKKKTRQRKKMREAEAAAERTRKKHKEYMPAKSPEPYIKPEPVSPPPFTNIPEHQATNSRPHYQLPPDVEIVSPQEFRPRPRQPYYQEQIPAPPLRYGSPAATVVRVAPPAAAGGYRRSRRDDQDLRRVASIQAAQRPPSPGYQPTSPVYSPVAPYRTASQPHASQSAQASPRYRMEPSRATSTYVRSERSMSPPQVRMSRDGYSHAMPPPNMMAPPAPPPRRIVVDQYGNQYVAAEEPAHTPAMPPQASRMSVAPQNRYEADVPYERAPSRASVMYTTQAPQSTYGDGNMSRMGPPPVRRVTVAESDGPDYRAYRQREYSRAPEPQYYREEPVYMREAMPPPRPVHRASVYPSEHNAPPPNYARAYSVRPDAEAVRYVSRAPSVMPQPEYVRMAESGGPPPGLRAVSVMPGSEYGRAPEARYNYGHPAPPPGTYPMAPPGGRYAEEEGAMGTVPPPARTEVYVDQYGREVRRVSGYQ